MPALARQSERRPSAPIARRAVTGPPALHRMVTRSLVDLDGFGFRLDQRQRRQLARPRRERGHQVAVLDIVTEGIEPDLAGVEAHLGRPQQPRVSSTIRITPQRRGVLPAALPHAQRSSAVTEPVSSAVVRWSGAAAALPTSTVSTPADASAIAAVRPAGPPPITDHIGRATVHPPRSR